MTDYEPLPLPSNSSSGSSSRVTPGSRSSVDFAPTYPLDSHRIRNVREDLLSRSPKYRVWHVLAQLGSRFTLLSRFADSWATIEPQLSSAVVDHVIKQSNAAQNEVIRSLINALKTNGCQDAGETLNRFLWLKQIIEAALKNNRRLSSQRASVETLVDSIMQEVCHEILLLTDLLADRNTVLEKAAGELFADAETRELDEKIESCEERIKRAYDTLKGTEKQVTFRQAPQVVKEEPRIPESPVLDQLIDALREENELSQTINDRIGEELPDDEVLSLD